MTEAEPRENPVAAVASWTAVAASFILSFATWLVLGQLAGYDIQISKDTTIYLAWVLPFCIDGYVVTALITWLNPVSERVAKFAYWNMYGAATVSVIAQSFYHGLSTYDSTQIGWRALLAFVIGAIPPLCMALAVHLRVLVRQAIKEAEHKKTTKVETERIQTPVITPELPKLHYSTVTPTAPKESAPLAPAVPVPSIHLSNNPRPNAQPKTKATSQPQDDIDLEKLAAQTRKLFADTGQTLGRGPLAKELGITEHQARKVLASMNGHGGK